MPLPVARQLLLPPVEPYLLQQHIERSLLLQGLLRVHHPDLDARLRSALDKLGADVLLCLLALDSIAYHPERAIHMAPTMACG